MTLSAFLKGLLRVSIHVSLFVLGYIAAKYF